MFAKTFVCAMVQVYCQLAAVSTCNTWTSNDKTYIMSAILYKIKKNYYYARKSIYHGCSVQTEIFVSQDYCWASLGEVTPNSDPGDGNFCIETREQTTKTLIRLYGCAGLSASYLFSYGLNRFSYDVVVVFLTGWKEARESQRSL